MTGLTGFTGLGEAISAAGGPGFRECDKSDVGAPLFRVLCERVGGSAEMLRAAIFIGGQCAQNIHADPDSFF